MSQDLKHSPRVKQSPVDRLPPSSVEAEQGVLGCVLLSPQDCMGECIEKLKAGPEVFYDLRHATLYTACVEMYDQQKGIDNITVLQWLKDRGQLDGVGGLAYIASLPEAVPTAAGLDYYLDIVLEKYTLRKLIQTCTSIVGRVFENENDVPALVDEAERDILKIAEGQATDAARDARSLVLGAQNTIETLWKNKGALSGIGTGFVDFDQYTTGLHEGEMIVIGARPSVGKTSLAMNIAEHVSVVGGLPVGVFSLEMTAEQLMLRMLCSSARVGIRAVNDGFLGDRDFPRLTSASGRIAGAKLWIDDTSALSILQLRARARRMFQQHGIRLFVIDYLQLLHSTSSRAENRQQEIADISGGIKALAKELRVPIIVLSQLNREMEKRGGRPKLSDLRESGAIEQDADVVGLLYRTKNGAKEEDDSVECDAVPVSLLIEKQRNGPSQVVVDLTFIKTYTRFESAAKVSLNDVPPPAPQEQELPNYDKD